MTKPADIKKVLLVCLGNICRSPAAEGVLRAKAKERGVKLAIDSAGTGGWHAGDPPDARMIRAAAKRGVDISYQRARQVDLSDFYQFDYLLAMDLSNHSDLLDFAPPNRTCDIRMFLDFANFSDLPAFAGGGEVREMPDPYYGGGDGFERVLDLIEAGAEGFLDHIEDESE